MKKREYFDKVKKTVDEGFTEYKEKLKKYNELKKEREEGHFSLEYLNNDILPKMNGLRQEMRSTQEKTLEKVRELTEEIKNEISKSDQIKPEELTEDVKLLQGGLSLREKDIEGIIERNENNRSMIQLALRYAEEHNLKVDTLYISGESELRQFDEIGNAIGTVVKWFDTDNERYYQRIYDTVFSEGSGASQVCSDQEEE